MSSAASGLRRFVAVVLALAAIAATLVAIQGAALRGTVLSTDGYVDHVARPLGADPAVKDALAAELAEQVIAGVDVSGNLEQFVPPLARPAVRAATRQFESQWRNELRPAIRREFDKPGFASLWEQANASAHRQLVDALSDRGVGDEVVVDLHAVLVAAVRDAGPAIDRELGLPGDVGTLVLDGIAKALPADVGRIAIDLSRVGAAERFVVRNADDLVTGAGVAAALLVLLALLIADRRARGVVLALVGTGVAVGAVALDWVADTGAENAGARVRGADGEALSSDMRVVVDTQARLIAEHMGTWITPTVLGGLGVALVGVILAIGTRNRAVAESPTPTTGWPADQRWS